MEIDYRNPGNHTSAWALSSLVVALGLCVLLFLLHPWQLSDEPARPDSTLTTSRTGNDESALGPAGPLGPIGGRPNANDESPLPPAGPLGPIGVDGVR